MVKTSRQIASPVAYDTAPAQRGAESRALKAYIISTEHRIVQILLNQGTNPVKYCEQAQETLLIF